MGDPRKSISLPFDIWQLVSTYLSVKDIVRLSLVSKSLYTMTLERSIWYDVLQDLLRILPVSRIQRSLLSMTAADCKSEAVRLARMDSTWRHSDIDPAEIRRFSCESSEVIQILFLPGGEWLLTLLSDGALRLYRWPDFGGPAVCSVEGFAEADQPIRYYAAGEIKLCTSTPNTVRVIVTETYDDPYVPQTASQDRNLI